MEKIKKPFSRILVFLFPLSLIFFATCSDCDNVNDQFHKFSDDDKGWFEYDINPLKYVTSEQDTFYVYSTNKVDSNYIEKKSGACPYYLYYNEGYTRIDMKNKTNFKGLMIIDGNNYLGELFIKSFEFYYYDQTPSLKVNLNIDSALIDTAFINNKLYTDVYKWNEFPEDTNIAELFFTKHYGLLKVKFKNGQGVEKIYYE